MRRPALLLFVAMGCSFDASGFGEPPASSNATSGASTGSPATVGESSGGGEVTTGETGVGPGSNSLSGSSGGEVTTEPGTATTGETTETSATTSTTTTTTTTEPGTSTTQPCEQMDAWVDADGDTFGDPTMPVKICVGDFGGYASNDDDCNDAAANANPMAKEICDAIDNDCDGLVDEYDVDTNKMDCNGCKFRFRDQRQYAFCTTEKNWDAARAACVAMGLDYTIDSDMPEHDWLVAQIDADSGYGALWHIGGREMSGFKWIDGSAVPADSRWFAGEPNDQSYPFDYGADCLALTAPGPAWGTKWIDWDCGAGIRFVCEQKD